MDIPIQHQGHFQCHHQAWDCSTHPGLHQKALLSLAILISTSPDAVKLLQQTPSSLTLLMLMMVPPWPNSSVAVILLSVMPMASNQPNNSSTPSLITSENGEPWLPSSVMEANMKSPSESLISSIPSSSKMRKKLMSGVVPSRACTGHMP